MGIRYPVPLNPLISSRRRWQDSSSAVLAGGRGYLAPVVLPLYQLRDKEKSRQGSIGPFLVRQKFHCKESGARWGL